MFDQRIETLLKRRADEVVFVELKEGKTIELNDTVVDHTIPLPIMVKNIVDQVKGISQEDIHLKSILEGMTYILGIDSDFPYKDQYMNFMRGTEGSVIEAMDRLSDLAIEDERYMDAIIALKCAHEFDPEQFEIKFKYARCCEAQALKSTHEPETEKILENEAYEVYLDLIEKNPNQPKVLYHIGFHLVNRKSFKAAKETWEHAIELGLEEEQQAEILQNLTHLWSKIQFEEGYLLILDGFPDEGLTKLLPLEEDNPEWWNLMFFIGLGYRQKEDFDNAIYYFKKTLNLNTGHVDTFNEIGLCYMSMGIFNEAENYFAEALRLNPNHHELLCNLGIVHMKLGRIEDAKKVIRQAYEIDPTDEVTQAWLKYLSQFES